MNKFEVVLILSPELGINTLKDELNKFRKNISSSEGKILNEEELSTLNFEILLIRFFEIGLFVIIYILIQIKNKN